MLKIRPYKITDRAVVRDICLITAFGGNKIMSANKQRLTLLSYCDYYIDNEPELAFVVVDDTDTPVGYIFGSADYHVFFDKMIEKYIPEMMKINIFYAYAFKLYLYFNKFYGRKYPAHMHIDITEGCRRQGAGRALADALTNALRIKNIPYLFLQTDAKNIRARAFYKSCGFKEISSLFGCVTYIFDISAS